MPPLDLTDAEHLKRVVVEPVVAALARRCGNRCGQSLTSCRQSSAETSFASGGLNRWNGAFGAVEQFKARIAAVCAGVAVVAGVAWRLIADRVGNFFLKGH